MKEVTVHAKVTSFEELKALLAEIEVLREKNEINLIVVYEKVNYVDFT